MTTYDVTKIENSNLYIRYIICLKNKLCSLIIKYAFSKKHL